jgi:hypothetical protein
MNTRRNYFSASKRARIAGDELAAAIAASSREWHTYMILAEKTKLVKIGHARDVAKRLEGLRAVNADSLRLLCVVPETEKELHKRFAHLRTHGEWFKYHNDIRWFVEHRSSRENHQELPAQSELSS